MDKREKARLLRIIQEKFGIDEVICMENGDKLPMEDFIAWVYERKDLDELELSERKKEFGYLLKPFFDDGTYPRALLSDFFVYWTEPNKSGTRMRWETEKTWSLPGRLRTFAQRSKYKITLPPSEMDFLDGNAERSNKPIDADSLFH